MCVPLLQQLQNAAANEFCPFSTETPLEAEGNGVHPPNVQWRRYVRFGGGFAVRGRGFGIGLWNGNGFRISSVIRIGYWSTRAPESTANRSSVLRRTTSYQGNQAHSSYRVVSAGSLAESASAVTRLHSYTMQMQRQRPPTATTTTTTSAPSLYDLPNELIEKILSYVDYKKVSNLRLVSALLPLCSTQSAGY